MTDPDRGWWNITTNKGRYTVFADGESEAEEKASEDFLHAGEVILDGLNEGPFATAEEAYDA